MLYLASESPRRARLLSEAGIPFKKIRSGYDEKNSLMIKPFFLVKKNALEKALRASRAIRNGKILGADTLVYFKKRILGKPATVGEALRTLKRLQGRWHVVYTGVALLELRSGRILRKRSFVEKTRVLLKKMDEKEIRLYLRRVDPLDKAGGYAIQETRQGIVRAVKGSFTNAVGLPMERLRFL